MSRRVRLGRVGRKHSVIPYGRWRPVALWLDSSYEELYAPLTFAPVSYTRPTLAKHFLSRWGEEAEQLAQSCFQWSSEHQTRMCLCVCSGAYGQSERASRSIAVEAAQPVWVASFAAGQLHHGPGACSCRHVSRYSWSRLLTGRLSSGVCTIYTVSQKNVPLCLCS